MNSYKCDPENKMQYIYVPWLDLGVVYVGETESDLEKLLKETTKVSKSAWEHAVEKGWV